MRCVVIVVFMSIPAFALAQQAAPATEGKVMDVVDYTVDYRDLKNARITLTGCEFGGSNSSWVFCRSATNSGLSVSIQAKTLNKEDFRRALKECSGHSGNGDRCAGAVVGNATEFMGPSLQKARIVWDKP